MKMLDDATLRLRAAGIEAPRLEARLLLAHAMQWRPEEFVSLHGEPNASQSARFESLLSRRIAHEPLAYILGRREFWSLEFSVGPGALIPRPESETLVEEALRRFPDCNASLNVLDLGTGSACLLLAFLSERPHAHGIGVEISSAALRFAADNAKTLGMEARAQFVQGDWGSALRGRFDAIFINPPYIERDAIARLAPDIALHEPLIALDGGADGFDAFRRIAPELGGLLGASGRVFMELGKDQSMQVSEIVTRAGLDVEEIVNDLAYIPRCMVVSGGNSGPRITRKKELEKEERSG